MATTTKAQISSKLQETNARYYRRGAALGAEATCDVIAVANAAIAALQAELAALQGRADRDPRNRCFEGDAQRIARNVIDLLADEAAKP
jgi:hypothetical protein